MPTLSITSGPDSGAQFNFDQTSVMTIGRGGAVTVALTDASVSRRHALVEWKDGAWGVQDLGSVNGTYLNGRRISQRAMLANGDSLKIGSVLCTFADAAATGERRPATDVAGVRNEASNSEIVFRVSAEVAAKASAGEHPAIGAAHRSRLVDSFSKITAMMFDECGLLAFIVDELLEMLPQARRVSVMMWDQDLSRFVPVATRARSDESSPFAASQTLLHDVLTRKDAVLVANVLTDRHYAQAESMLALKMTSAVCAPILFQEDILGVIQVAGSGPTPFTQPDVTMTMALALHVGMALAYARLHAKLVERELLERDLALARKIQHHFLPPRAPDAPGFDFSVEYRPALAVGGDLYDFVPLAGGSIAVAIGDVSGKGVSAALFAAKVLSDLRYQAAGQTSASEILRRANQVIAAGNEEGMFVTVALAVIHPLDASLTVASAGHPLPLVRDASGAVTPVGSSGDKPLGLDENAAFREFRYEMDPGDGVVLYTDGVIEALNRENERYGDDRLAGAIRKAPAGADAVVRAITADVRAFAVGSQGDDVTVVCFTRK